MAIWPSKERRAWFERHSSGTRVWAAHRHHPHPDGAAHHQNLGAEQRRPLIRDQPQRGRRQDVHQKRECFRSATKESLHDEAR